MSYFKRKKACMVDVTKIEIGKIYKYGQLCELFREDRKSSNSKSSQLKEWERFFRWQNITAQKYRIEEIYDIPKEKMDGRKKNGGNSTSKYLAMDDGIMKLLNKENEMEVTVAVLLSQIGLLLPDYNHYKRNPRFFVDQGYSEGVVNHLFWRMAIVERAVKSSIERLKKERYLNCKIETILIRTDNSSEILTSVEIDAEKKMKEQIMRVMNIRDTDLYQKDKKKDFDGRYKEGLRELFGDNASYIFQRYNLTRLEKEYTCKSRDGLDGLTRKFVKEICIYMLTLDYKGFYQKENTERQVVSLLEQLFVRMNAENWNRYKEEDFETNKEMLFFTEFYTMQGGWRENGRITFKAAEKKDTYRKGIKQKKESSQV